jgi:hypothetical protein
MAWRWSYGKERRLCVLNFSDYEGTGRVIVSDAEGEGDIPIVELLSGTRLLHTLHLWVCHQRLWWYVCSQARSTSDQPRRCARMASSSSCPRGMVRSSRTEQHWRGQRGADKETKWGRGNSITYAELSKEIVNPTQSQRGSEQDSAQR